MNGKDEIVQEDYPEYGGGGREVAQESSFDPNPLEVMSNLRDSHAAFLGFTVAVIALIGIIFCYAFPWISYEGERQEYDGETGEYVMVEESESIGYGEFDDRENMDRMRWPTERSSDFYKDAASWSMGGFRILLFVGVLTYLLAVYQHSNPCNRFFNLFPGHMTDPQKRLLMLHLISGIVVLYSALTIRSVFRFFQLQLVYNHNSEVFGTNQTIFAGWAGVAILLTAGSILIISLTTIYSILRTGWSNPASGESISYSSSQGDSVGDDPESLQDPLDIFVGRSRTFGLISMTIIIVAIAGIILSLILPTLSLSTNFFGGQEETEVLVDDGTIHEFEGFPWYLYDPHGGLSSGVNRELGEWSDSSQSNVTAFQGLLFLGLLSSLGMTFHTFGNRQYFTLVFWGSIGLITLVSISVMISNIQWIRGAGNLGDELFATLAWWPGFTFETKFVYNYFPLLISSIATIAFPVFIYLNRYDIISGLSRIDEEEADQVYPSLPVFTNMSSGGYSSLPMHQIAASFIILLLIAISFGAFAQDFRLGSGADEPPERPWVPVNREGEREDDHLDENTQREYSYWPGIDSIFAINFTLRWTDEEDEPMATNDPDEFRLTVETPWGETQRSEWVANEHGEEGIIELKFMLESDPGPTQSLGHFNATVECGECGDQWYTNPPTIGLTDGGNDYTLTHEYGYWVQV